MSDLDGQHLAEIFKREFNEQFNMLVRMHLSFVLDLNTEENEYVFDENKPNKFKKSKGVMAETPLTQEFVCRVYQLIEYLQTEERLKNVGIFRRTGSIPRQQELKNLLSQGVTLDLENGRYTVHDCASVLKELLANLSEPLLIQAFYPAYYQIAELCKTPKKLSNATSNKLLLTLQLIILLIPTQNKILLKDVLKLLNLTCSYESYNRMNADNLAKLFAPHLICRRHLSPEQFHEDATKFTGIIAFMIQNYNDLFRVPHCLIVDFRANYGKYKLLQQQQQSTDQSILNDGNAAVTTVYTFVDRELTAKILIVSLVLVCRNEECPAEQTYMVLRP